MPNGGYSNPAPAIHLKGLWLKEAGFKTGDTLTVNIVDGCLIICHHAKEGQSQTTTEAKEVKP